MHTSSFQVDTKTKTLDTINDDSKLDRLRKPPPRSQRTKRLAEEAVLTSRGLDPGTALLPATSLLLLLPGVFLLLSPGVTVVHSLVLVFLRVRSEHELLLLLGACT